MPYVDAGGIRTYYEVEGEGQPLLLLHGGTEPIETMAAQRAALVPRFRVWLPERRGHGRTPDVEGPYRYEDLARDTAAFMAAVGVESAHVVGFSDGAIVGLLLALRRPELVRRLVSISGNFHPGGVLPEEEVPARGRFTGFRGVPEHYARLSPDGPDHYPVMVAKVERMWREEPQLTAGDLAGIRSRTLVIAADADMIRLEHTVELYRALPDARLAIVADAGHDLVVTKPEIVNATIVDFFAAP